MTGSVQTSDGQPLSHVAVYYYDFPNTELMWITNNQGSFSVSSVCYDQQFAFVRHGYKEAYFTAKFSEVNVKVTMENE